ncbi:leucine Rich Repeat family protein [Trichuris trichiura]|uniref:Leucine Rich Repeat family protein n=1 Tax=Trichuris trichiura TaxID=36087 RepID=A0A077Z1K5_TRITR|nr:leucine Rich Repeat family protein [Trichuris trichiura]
MEFSSKLSNSRDIGKPIFAALLVSFLTSYLNALQGCPMNMQREPCTCFDPEWQSFDAVPGNYGFSKYGKPMIVHCNAAENVQELRDSLLPLQRENTEILLLRVFQTDMKNLTTGIFERMYISRLSLRKNGLRSIEPTAFSGIIQDTLESLDLNDNDFEAIPVEALRGLKQLRHLSLANNKILFVSSNTFAAFASRDRLRSLDLSGNFIQQLHPMATAALVRLEDLNLQRNNFTDVPLPAIQKHFSTLKNLDLALNYFSKMPSPGLQLPQLRSLSLEYNKINSLLVSVFEGTPNLLYLYLSGNKLQKLDPRVFCNVRELQYLSLGDFGVKRLNSEMLQCLPDLSRLDITDSSLENIEIGALQKLPNLATINLRNNKIKRIDRSTFAGLEHLYSIDLSNNGLRKISNFAFSSLRSLRHLDISRNELKLLEPNTFDQSFQETTDGRSIYLCNNPWICDIKLNWFRRWLRENIEIAVDRPDCQAVCQEPPQLLNWPIRFLNPPPQHVGNMQPNFVPPQVESSVELTETEGMEQTTSRFEPHDSSIVEVLTGTVPKPLKQLFNAASHGK